MFGVFLELSLLNVMGVYKHEKMSFPWGYPRFRQVARALSALGDYCNFWGIHTALYYYFSILIAHTRTPLQKDHEDDILGNTNFAKLHEKDFVLKTKVEVYGCQVAKSCTTTCSQLLAWIVSSQRQQRHPVLQKPSIFCLTILPTSWLLETWVDFKGVLKTSDTCCCPTLSSVASKYFCFRHMVEFSIYLFCITA